MRAEPRGLAALIAGAIAIGTAPILVRFAGAADPEIIGFYRMSFALPPLAIAAIRANDRASRAGAGWAVLSGVCFAFDLTLWHASVRHTSVAVATLLVALSPLWIALFSRFVLNLAMPVPAAIGLGLALVGAAALAITPGARVSLGLGEALAATASLGYAGYTMSLSRARRSLDAASSLFLSAATSCLCFAAVGLALGHRFGGFPETAWLSFVGLAIVVQLVAWFAIAWGLGMVDPRVSALVLLLQPVSSTVLGFVILGERLEARQILGAGLVLSGIGVTSFVSASGRASG